MKSQKYYTNSGRCGQKLYSEGETIEKALLETWHCWSQTHSRCIQRVFSFPTYWFCQKQLAYLAGRQKTRAGISLIEIKAGFDLAAEMSFWWFERYASKPPVNSASRSRSQFEFMRALGPGSSHQPESLGYVLLGRMDPCFHVHVVYAKF